MFKRATAILLALTPLVDSALEVELHAPTAILINADTGGILFEKGARERHYPASTTKIATALFILEQEPDLDGMVVAQADALIAVDGQVKRRNNFQAPSYWNQTDGAHIGIKEGEVLPLRTLLEGMLVASGNDAANVLAQHFGGEVPTFVEQVNGRLEAWGCRQTHFTNPHGLHHPNHTSSAYDLALMARRALTYPAFREIVQMSFFHRPPDASYPQINRLVRKGKYFYPKAIGVKTGTTRDAGACLVAAAADGDRTLIAVVLGCEDIAHRFEDTTALFEAAFAEQPVIATLLPTGAQLEGPDRLKGTLEEPLTLTLFSGEDIQIETEPVWDSGEVVAFSSDHRPLARVPMKVTKGNHFEQQLTRISKWPKGAKVALVFGGTACCLFLLYRLRRK